MCRIELMMMLMFQCLAGCEVRRQYQKGKRVTLPVTCHCWLRDEGDHPDTPPHPTGVEIRSSPLSVRFMTYVYLVTNKIRPSDKEEFVVYQVLLAQRTILIIYKQVLFSTQKKAK